MTRRWLARAPRVGRSVVGCPAGLGLAIAAGCGSRPEAAPAPPEPSAAAPALPADTMVLVTRSGHRIWLAEGRPARDSAGTPCYERSVEIRTDSSRIKVPLLFVANPPRERAGRLEAELSLNCRPLALYSIDLATGRPSKLADR